TDSDADPRVDRVADAEPHADSDADHRVDPRTDVHARLTAPGQARWRVRNTASAGEARAGATGHAAPLRVRRARRRGPAAVSPARGTPRVTAPLSPARGADRHSSTGGAGERPGGRAGVRPVSVVGPEPRVGSRLTTDPPYGTQETPDGPRPIPRPAPFRPPDPRR